MKDKISVIVPVYNVEKYLEECLDSLINQTYNNIEIILINDGSTDNSLKICKKYKKIDSRIILINKKNEGVSSARNVGLRKATGKYIMFVDSDDYLELEAVELLSEYVYRDTLVIFGFNRVYKNRVIKMLDDNLLIKSKNEMERSMFLNNNIGGYIANKVFNKNIIDKYNIYFNEKLSFCEDLVFILEYIKYCKKYKYVNKSFYNYRMRISSVSNSYLTRNNTSIMSTYDLLLNNIKDKVIINNIKCRYIEAYYIYRKYLKDYSPNMSIIKEEKEIIKNNYKTVMSKVRFFIIKYFYDIGLLYKRIENIRFKFFE